MKLSDWLHDEQMTYTDAARLFGCSRPAVYYYATGRMRPGPQFTENIKQQTGGQVTADDHQIAYMAARS